MKKIIPALAMLLISAIVMSTASFAWFSMNGTVQAKGMSVKAVTSGDLQIAATNNEKDFGTSANFKTGTLDLKPASTAGTIAENASVPNFYYLSKSVGIVANNSSYGVGSEFAAVTPTIANDGSSTSEYYTMDSMYLRYKSTQANTTSQKLYLSGITVVDAGASSSTSALNQALRVMIVTREATTVTTTEGGESTSTDGKVVSAFIYDADGIATADTYNAVDGTGTVAAGATEGTMTLASEKSITTSTNATELISEMKAETVYRVDVYVWYEGQDGACSTTNATIAAPATVDLEFSTSAPASN